MMIDNCKIKDQTKTIAQVRKVTWVGAGVNVFLALVKFVFGTWGNSKAVVADAVHSLSDLGTDFAVLLGVKYWSKPADEDHPYGHGRIETLVTAFISLSLIIVAVGIGYSAVVALRKYEMIQPSWIAFLAAFISIFSKESLYRWTLKEGRKLRSSAVIANAWHHRTDAMSSLPVCIAVAISLVNKKWFFWDNLGAFIVSLFILYSAFGLLAPVFAEFIGEGADEKEKQRIKNLVLGVKGVKTTHKIRTRKQGSGWYVDLHIEVAPELTVKEGHDISTAVQERLIAKGPDILDVIVHLEPFEE
jgi:cation diffusion facilitator family transporter